MANIKMLSPWVKYVKELEEMFLEDPTVHVVYDEDAREIRVYVDDAEKADALFRLLPNNVQFGNVELTILVIPANPAEEIREAADNATLVERAFRDNGAFVFSRTIRGVFSNDLTYVVFRNVVVQYFTDDLGDIFGLESTLYEDIARDVFSKREGLCFCTDLPDEERLYGGGFRP